MASRIEQIIEEIEEYVDSCRFQPLSTTKIVVNKEELEELLRELRLKTPDEIKRYQKIISNKDAILADAQAKADGIIASADINSVEDLKGKTIGLDTSSTAYFFCLTVLQSAGLTEKDVTLIDMDSDSTGPAFMAGQIDAAVTWEPFLSTASDREGGHLLCDSADYPGTILDVLTVRQDLSDEAKQALANAWYDAVDYLKANEDESVKIMAEGLELTVEEAADELSGVSFYGREENKAFIDKDSGNSIFDIAKRAQDFWLELGIISSEIDLDTFISAEYFG